MKKEIIIGIVGIVIIVGLVWFFSQSYQKNMENNNALINNANLLNTVVNNQALTNSSGSTVRRLDAVELAKHASASDCWLLISGKVYNVTSYLATHPGGRDIVLPYCGKDATQAFATKGGRGQSHSGIATEELGRLFVADFNSILSMGTETTSDTGAGTNSQTTETVSPVSGSGTTPATSNVVLDMATVAKHASATDCWIVVSGKVYNVTSYIYSHPGGSSQIIPRCGQEATTAFATQGGQGSHSSTAYSLLARYLIGSVGSTTTQEVITNTNTSVQQAGTNTNTEDEHEEDEEEDEEDDN